VEDNIQNIEIYQHFLKNKEYLCSGKTSGLEGLEEFIRNPPDLLILDIGIPDLDGLTFIKRVFEMVPQWTGAILAITGYAQSGDMEKIIEAGATSYFSKPIKLKTFLEKVDELLNK
jgi:two-component system cell cycle response regulator/two-component system cell cycle response regulator DivK